MDDQHERPRDTDAPDPAPRGAEPHGGDRSDRSPAVPSGPPEVRVGDAERQAAMRALDAHLEAGRLSVDEYGDRSAAAVVATVRSDLAGLFVDLPAPHPLLPDRAGAVARATLSEPLPRAHPQSPAIPLAAFAAIMMLMVVPVVAGLAVGAGLHLGGLFLLPLLFMTMGGVHRRRGGPHHH